MKTLSFCFFMLLFLSNTSFAQDTWNVQIPYESADHLSVVSKMIPSNDGGFLVLVNKFIQEDFVKAKHSIFNYNADGQLQWEKDYNLGEYSPTIGGWAGPIPKDMIQLDNDNIIGIGEIRTGDTSFCYTFITDHLGDSLSFLSSPCYTKLVFKNANLYALHKDSINLKLLLSLDHFGNIIDETILGDFPITDMLINNDQELFLSQSLLPEKYRKFDISSGNFLVEKTSSFEAKFLTINEENSITGYDEDLVKMNSNLEELWVILFEEIFPNSSTSNLEGTGIIHTSDLGYLLIGDYLNEDFGFVYIHKFDQNGTKEWGGIYDGFYLPIEHIQDVVEVEDGYVFIGTNPKTERIWLIKLNKEGLFTTSVEDKNPLINSFQLYPNPTKNNIQLTSQQAFSGFIQITDLLGRKVFFQELSQMTNFNKNISHYFNAPYFLQVFNEEGILIQNFPFTKY